VFAEKGYRGATIADICRRAGANIAAVNYYFGDKATLYAEAWRQAFERSLEAHPPDGGVPVDAPAEERLRGRVLSILRRVADPGSREFAIVRRELANPTGLLAEVMRECIGPMREELARVVREMLGPKASDRDVQMSQMSIMAQCFHSTARWRHARLCQGRGSRAEKSGAEVPVESLADHIVTFSVAGIREVRRRAEAERGSARMSSHGHMARRRSRA
jgi:AcrR family transcriptional regulator